MLYIIGLGLGDADDVTIKGASAIQKSTKVFLEMYTAILGVDNDALAKKYGKELIIADREMVESNSDAILEPARTEDVSFLVVGDSLCATTHMDLFTRAREMGIKVQIIHNASIMNACAACGLQLYAFGQTISIPFYNEDWRPDSFYHKMKFNLSGGLHTLCLLDIKVREPDFKALLKGRKAYLPPRYMTINTAIEQLLECEETLSAKGEGGCISKDTKCFGVARVGQDDQVIVSGTMEELLPVDFGAPLHSLVVAGEMHDMENTMYDYYHVSKVQPPQLAAAGAAGGDSGSDSDEPDFYA